MTRRQNDAFKRADALIAEILKLIAATKMDADTQAALELELLALRVQVEIARKESEKKSERELTRGYC